MSEWEYGVVTSSGSGSFPSFEWKSTPPENFSLVPSEDITGVEFLGRYVNYTNADTWYPSWASDDAMYSPFTDGEVGCIASNSIGGIATTGHAKITGSDPMDLKVEALGTTIATPLPYGGVILPHHWCMMGYGITVPIVSTRARNLI